ncbi:hypothetical protein Q31b_50880 [Novipirellula aureliae]|uniref:Rad50/SbcC-type AAA domain-containing protein n=1 Tax=Novipirellula aureliae TaxID=2527966 RepID=A0A5C6DEK6_9BACT|nr:hypothetical protein [Novipirellula aureliae]TWU35653.1 hypothetical protein Q31b_50880 [Novipirellula aureliae]
MTDYGFYIERVWLTGPDVAEAAVDFQDGLNVVSGPSNTGKTYISQCIDYAFGRKNAPKEIPEARGYDELHVRIQPRSKPQSLTIRRSLRCGNTGTVSEIGDERVLKATHSDDRDDNISALLLELCGLRNKRITTNGKGKTRSVSFRDISHLTIISEEQIIRNDSPIWSGNYQEHTLRQSIFRLLLTGVDDSSVIEKKEEKVSRAENRGKGEVLEKIKSDLQVQIAQYNSRGSADELRSQRDRLARTINELSAFLETQKQDLAGIESERLQTWTELQRIESRQEVVEQLLVRFSLLAEQYESDRRRLESINEVGNRLEELSEERCPICGAPSEYHSEDHKEGSVSPEEVSVAAAAEITKVNRLQKDLTDTIRDTRNESDDLASQRVLLETSLTQVTQRLHGEYQPKVADTLQQYQQLLKQQTSIAELIGLYDRLEQLEAIEFEAKAILAAETSGDPIITKISSDLAAPFCLEVERLLEAWQLPDRGRVAFSESSQDIVIGDRARRVDGKGIRAITHAAFSFALNNYCVNRKLPTSSIVILDSPLVVYREPDETELEFSLDVKANFYSQLANGSDDRQVVIFENDDPPTDLSETVNMIHFTKSEDGRYGFIPRNLDAADSGE